MSRWFRFYDDAINDPKILKLSDKTYRIWVGMLCLASKNDGVLPPFEDIALLLRMKPEKLQPELEKLITAGLLDHSDIGIAPHNWNKRQFKSDVSTERVKRFRNAERNVSETPPETEQIQTTEPENKTEATASGADAPRDVRKDLFDTGLKTLARITGKTPDSCRSLVGRLLKSVNDEAIHVLGAIEDAERNRVADPVAWITKTLQPRVQNGQGRPRTVQQAAQDQLDRIRSINAPPPPTHELELQPGIRDGTGAPNVRLLPSR